MYDILNIMKKKASLLPTQQRILKELGDNIKLARLRRKISTEQVSLRANIARQTLWAIENGSPSVSMGAYLRVLHILGLERDLVHVAKDDELGRKLQDSRLIVKERAPKRVRSKKANDTEQTT